MVGMHLVSKVWGKPPKGDKNRKHPLRIPLLGEHVSTSWCNITLSEVLQTLLKCYFSQRSSRTEGILHKVLSSEHPGPHNVASPMGSRGLAWWHKKLGFLHVYCQKQRWQPCEADRSVVFLRSPVQASAMGCAGMSSAAARPHFSISHKSPLRKVSMIVVFLKASLYVLLYKCFWRGRTPR